MDVEEEDVKIEFHDVTLTGRIYRPSRLARSASESQEESQTKSFAVIAHPWSRLGGSMDDRIVVVLAYALVSSLNTIPVITYNARGVGGSTSRSSWIGCETEKRDYEDVVRWGLHRFSWLRGKDEETTDRQTEKEVTVYCCGYSQGSLLAPFTPSRRISHHHHGLHHKVTTSTGLTWIMTFRYILISPPLAYTWFLMPFKRSAYDQALIDIMELEVKRRARAEYQDWKSPILVAWGTEDNFISNLAEWRQTLRVANHEREEDNKDLQIDLFTAVEFQCDHFWALASARTRLVAVIQAWL